MILESEMILGAVNLGKIARGMIVGSFLGGAAINPVVARAGDVQALPAYQFVNSIGVDTHFTWGPSPYRKQYAQAKSALAELGIRHLRDAVGNSAASAIYRDLHDSLGVKLCAVVDGRTGSGAHQRLDNSKIPGLLQRAKSQIGVGMLKAFEGPNEYNLLERTYGYTNWPQELRSFQTALMAHVKADPDLASLPVIAPSMADPMQESYYARLGDLSGAIDRGNAHVYPNWLSWDEKIGDVTPFARIIAPKQPMWVSETGWHTAIHSGAQWVPDDVLIKYLPRAMASFISTPGVERAYIYQLIDPDYDPNQKVTTANFGLLDFSVRRKPAFYAVRNTMQIMCDDPKTTADSLRYSLTGNLKDVRSLLFQKQSGAFYLMIWLEKQSFQKNQELNNPPQAVRINFEQNINRARLYRPSDQSGGLSNSNQPKQTYANPGHIDLAVGDALTIVEIAPGRLDLPPVATSCSFKPS